MSERERFTREVQLLLEPLLFFPDGLLEPLFQEGQFGDQICDGVHEGVMGRVVCVCSLKNKLNH